ncbi:MAG: DUF928 domain-containing protein [Cyanothece sp. SIO2G6]|nr:DUF928 domain-containing protein [Cyanothece sp. SIO2G6]
MPKLISSRQRWLWGAIATPLLTTILLVSTPATALAETGLAARLRSLFGGDQVEGQAAGRGRGGAVRGETCNAFHQIRPDAPVHDNLIALMPQANEGKTLARYPTFWFYLPLDSSSEAVWAEFELVDKNDNSVLKEEVLLWSLPEQPGIFSVTIPTSATPLEINERYRWYFVVVCNEFDYSINPAVEGWIERVEHEDIAQQLGVSIDAPPENLLSIYTDYSLWYETVSLLVNTRETQPELWAGFLDLFGLTTVDQELIVQPLVPLD